MGLPHPVFNVACDLAKNPTFSLTVRRPSDVRLVLTQRDASGVAPPGAGSLAGACQSQGVAQSCV